MEHQHIKYIKSLHQKKQRSLYQEFIVEGVKMVNELIASSMNIKTIYSTHPQEIQKINVPVEKISEKDLLRMSHLKNPNKVLARVAIPQYTSIQNEVKTQLSLILENIQDPGNMGTIIRLANWYGINHIFCSYDTVDCYNSKVVQASMGALFRINIHYTNITELITKASTWSNFAIYATHLQGKSIYETDLNNRGFIIMGNESKGLSEKISGHHIQKIKLPSYPQKSEGMESLNVAIATAITVAEFRRRLH